MCPLTNKILFQYLKVSNEINGEWAYLIHSQCQGQFCPENCAKQMWRYWTGEGWKADTFFHVKCGEKRAQIILHRVKSDLTIEPKESVLMLVNLVLK